MSSNVGLSTPRGSGTSGYVQRNLSHLKPRDYPPPTSSAATASNTREYRQRQPDKEILEHDRKRGVEVKCLEFRDKLEDEGVDEDEIDERVEVYRKELLGELEREGEGWDVTGGKGGGRKGGFKPHQVHEIAAAKAGGVSFFLWFFLGEGGWLMFDGRGIVESERLRNALGISKDYREVCGIFLDVILYALLEWRLLVADALVFRWWYCREVIGRSKRRKDKNAWRIERRRLRQVGGGALLRLKPFFSFFLSFFLSLVYRLEYDSMGRDLLQYDAVLFVLASAWDHWYGGDCSIHLLEVAGVYNSFYYWRYCIVLRAVAHLFSYFSGAHTTRVLV